MLFSSVEDMALRLIALPRRGAYNWVCKFFLYQGDVALLGGEGNDRGYRRAGAGPSPKLLGQGGETLIAAERPIIYLKDREKKC